MDKYRAFVWAVVVIGAVLSFDPARAAAQDEPRNVVAAVARDFYPEYTLDAEGRPGGFGIDLMNAVAKRAGLTVTYRVFEAWSDLVTALERGEADLAPVVAITPAREQRLLFTRPVVTSSSTVFVRRDTDDVQGVSNLAGRRVGVIAGGVSEVVLSERQPGARLIPYPRLQDALFGLMSGEVDALVSFEGSVWKVGERVRLADQIKGVGDPLTEVKRAIAVRRDLTELRDRLDATLADFLQSPEYARLHSSWYIAAPSLWNPERAGWLTGASTALLLLGMLLWQSLSLRAESRRLAESAPWEPPAEPLTGQIPIRVSQACAGIGLALGLAVLLGWAFDVLILKTALPGLFAMQPWAATAIALAGASLLAATLPGRIAATTSTALAGLVLIVGLQTLLQYAADLDLGTDRWLFPAAVSNQPGHPHPGRVAEVTAVAFVLLGTMLLLARVETAWARWIFSTIGTLGLLLMAAPLLGYLVGAGTLQSVAFFTPIALHAALGLVVLFTGVLALRPKTGWMAVLSGDTPGAASVRMLLPVAVTGPVLLAWLSISGRGAGLYGPDFQIGLLTLATIALLGNALLWNAARLDRLHHARLAGTQALRESEARFRGTFENAAVGISNVAMDGTWLRVNQRFCEILGYSRDELLRNRFQDLTHPEDLPSNLQQFVALIRGEIQTYQLQKRYLHKDGHTVWVTLTAAAQRSSDGRPAYCIAIIEDISARKLAEQALRESEARLRRAIEYAPFPIMVHAEDGEVVHLSRAWLQLTGYPREEIDTIASWTDRAYGDRQKGVRADIDRLYALDQAVDEGEELIRCADGRTRVWTFSSASLGGDDCGRRLVVTMAADVTERKEAEQALRDSELRMRALLDASQDEILLLSTAGEILAINKAAERRLAKRTEGTDPVGVRLDRLVPADQADARMAIVRQVATTATLVHCDTPIRSRWFEFWFYPVLQPDRPVSEVAVYAREITQQKKSQADLGKLFQAIQQSPTSVVITDREGKIEYVNPKFTEVTGYTPAEAIGRNPRVLKSGQTPPEVYAELWQTITSGRVWRGELLNRKKSGELFWELASIAPVKNGETVTNFVAVKEDITERKQMEEQLRQTQKMQAVGQLTAGIAHDFNNLLAIVIGNLQLLEERVDGDTKIREFLDDALWSATRAAELTHRLLAFARKQPLKPTAVDCNEVVGGVGEILRRTMGVGIRVEESTTPNLWQAHVDRGELERALVNLAVNARDAMRSAGTLALETRNVSLDEDYAEQYDEVKSGDYVLLAVTDTGSGMPAEIAERAFEPFFTTKPVGQGSGLGLSMVYGFVKQSGGHISIYSRVGQGTSVKLYLPRAWSLGREDISSETLPDELGNQVVLVVEDEPKLRKVAVKMLERLGLRSLQADTAGAALELLADRHVDVLFTDIELPGGMNGTELAERAHQLYPRLKVLFTTGYAREASLHERGLHEHAPWLLKPYSHQELARQLKALHAPTVH